MIPTKDPSVIKFDEEAAKKWLSNRCTAHRDCRKALKDQPAFSK